MTAAPASASLSVSSAMRARGQWKGFFERLDRLRIDPDDRDLLARERAGEQRVGGAALEAGPHLGRECHPRDTGDDDSEDEHRHQPSDQHAPLHGCDLRLRVGCDEAGRA